MIQYNISTSVKTLIRPFQKEGINLERIIERWLNANPTISFDELKDKITQYIKAQFKKEDLKEFFEDCSC